MPPIPTPTEEGFTATTAVPLYWCSYGSSSLPPLLVLHGGPGADHRYLLPQMLRLAGPGDAPRRRLVFYDQRGGGQSRDDERDRAESITWETHVHDLAGVLDELDIDPPAIVGYSWGALLAVLYAREAARGAVRPAPSTLVLVDPAPISRTWRDAFERDFARRQGGDAIRARREALAASGLRERDPDAYRQQAFELSVAGYFADPAAARDLTPFRVTGRVQQSVWASLGNFDLADDTSVRDIQARTLVVHGDADPIPLASSQALARAVNARLVVLSESGHVPYVEQPDALFAVIDSFLATR